MASSLAPDELNHSLAAFDRSGDFRQRAQCQFDQLSIAQVANSDPQDRGAVVTGSPTNGKVTILGDENRRAGNGFIPNLLVGRGQQPEFDKVNRLTTGLAQRLCQ